MRITELLCVLLALGGPVETFSSLVTTTVKKPNILRSTASEIPSATTFVPIVPAASVTTPVASPHNSELKNHHFACLLTAMAGVADIFSYQRYGCYSNMMTGNTLRLVNSLLELRWPDVGLYASMITAYIVGTMGYSWMVKVQKKPDRFQWYATGLFVLADVGAVIGLPWRMLPPIFAMGFALINANALHTTSAITNAMTGHMHKVGGGLVDRLLTGSMPTLGHKGRDMILSFVAGIFVTGLVHRRLPANFPMGVSLSILYFLVFRWYERPDRTVAAPAA